MDSVSYVEREGEKEKERKRWKRREERVEGRGSWKGRWEEGRREGGVERQEPVVVVMVGWSGGGIDGGRGELKRGALMTNIQQHLDPHLTKPKYTHSHTHTLHIHIPTHHQHHVFTLS